MSDSYYITFDAAISSEVLLNPKTDTILNGQDIDKFVLEWATNQSFSEKTVENGKKNTFFVEFSDKALHNGEVDVQFSLRGIDANGLESDAAYYDLTLGLGGHNVGHYANVPLHDGIALLLFITFYGSVSRTRH